MDWFSSDSHFDHPKIRLYCKRPFATVEEMNQAMINRWNAVVKPGDRVFHLGDVAFNNRRDSILKLILQLQGQKFLIKGNHDHHKTFKGELLKAFVWMKDYHELKIDDNGQKQLIVLFHYPISSWKNMHHGSWHLHGHCHGTLREQKLRRLDVGVDVHQLRPISYTEVKEIMARRTFIPVDHHGEPPNEVATDKNETPLVEDSDD